MLPAAPPAPLQPLVAPAALPSLIRVGLESDLEVVTVPCCDAGLEAHVLGESFAVSRGVTIRPAPEARGLGVFRLQVGALRDESQAHRLAERLGSAMGAFSDVVFDAAAGLHKVRVGSYSDRGSADLGKRRLAELGVQGAFTVHEDRGLENAGLLVDQGAGGRRVSTRAVELTTPAGVVRYGKSAYRGRLRVFLNERGRLNVVNELDLESYLRGVVPMELGPELYPQLDALKAQAVAARTYTVRNLGRFRGDGYDICATPRCQVYGGIAVEHPLSDRAIAETAGELALFEGVAIDALYSSTCGGRTEGVSWVFPEKSEPYLSSVPCVEAGGSRFGSAGDRPALGAWLLEVTLGRIAGDERARLEERIRRLAQLVAVPRPGERLESLERTEVKRFLGTQLDLALDTSLLAAGPPGAAARAGWTSRDRRLGLLLDGAPRTATSDPPSATLDGVEADELVIELLRYFEKLDQVEGGFLDANEKEIEIARGGPVARLTVAASVGTWRFDGTRQIAGALELAPGDPVDLYLVRGSVIAVVQHASRVGASAAVHHDRQRWSRFRGRGRVGRSVQERFPGFVLEDLVVLERGASGRVASLELVGRDGRREVLSGLPIRWTLDVPDTWFELHRTRSGSGEDGWLVEGRGWGHGVGMCQVGAFAMARRGHDYRQILEHYYRGVEVRRVGQASVTAVAGEP
ncbi:MAG TPA: SpoIID/LytB domain-containing protein [Thermoanaerobaculia bacterium]|nr:SpoIID/LytB domain-containing protein [Thermoanaerobaculia bacterium]